MNIDCITINEYELPTIIRNNVRVDWVNLNEGHSGDYDPTDKYDENLLRFEVYRFDGSEWLEVPDASYCTQMPASSPHQVLKVGLKIIMDAIYDDVRNHGKAKRICESLSWIKPEDAAGFIRNTS
jgi:hypothetical protein